jgi:hypothetical protein
MTNRTWIRLFAAISTFLFLFDFNRFSFRSGETEQYCWPHWMGCKALPLFEGLPNSYDHTMLFTLIFALILATFWFIAVGKEKVFIPLLWALTIIKIFFYYKFRLSIYFATFDMFNMVYRSTLKQKYDKS